jgi:biotin operon repressor
MCTLDKLTKKFVDDQVGLNVADYYILIHSYNIEIHVGFKRELFKSEPNLKGSLEDWRYGAEEHIELLNRNGYNGFEISSISHKGYTIASEESYGTNQEV